MAMAMATATHHDLFFLVPPLAHRPRLSSSTSFPADGQTLWNNIVVCGALSLTPGYVERLSAEINSLAPPVRARCRLGAPARRPAGFSHCLTVAAWRPVSPSRARATRSSARRRPRSACSARGWAAPSTDRWYEGEGTVGRRPHPALLSLATRLAPPLKHARCLLSVPRAQGTFQKMWISRKEYNEQDKSIVEKRCP